MDPYTMFSGNWTEGELFKMCTFTFVFFSHVVCSEGGVYLILAGKQTKKREGSLLGIFPRSVWAQQI